MPWFAPTSTTVIPRRSTPFDERALVRFGVAVAEVVVFGEA